MISENYSTAQSHYQLTYGDKTHEYQKLNHLNFKDLKEMERRRESVLPLNKLSLFLPQNNNNNSNRNIINNNNNSNISYNGNARNNVVFNT